MRGERGEGRGERGEGERGEGEGEGRGERGGGGERGERGDRGDRGEREARDGGSTLVLCGVSHEVCESVREKEGNREIGRERRLMKKFSFLDERSHSIDRLPHPASRILR